MALWQPGRRMEQARLQMIEQAVKDKAPILYRQLKKEGSLKQFVAMREKALMEEFDEQYEQILGEMGRSDLPFQKRVATHHMKINEVWHIALTHALDFPTTESTRAT